MSVVLNPYVNFSGQAREAMTFYQAVLGGELVVTTFGQSQVPDQPADGIMHAQLNVDGSPVLMGSDGMDNGGVHSGFSLSLGGNEADKLRQQFAKLSEGGKITLPLSVQTWGDEFGMLTDKFGISWMVNISAR